MMTALRSLADTGPQLLKLALKYQPIYNKVRLEHYVPGVEISEAAPAQLRLTLAEIPEVESLLPVIAIDAPPAVSLELPASVQSQTELQIEATAEMMFRYTKWKYC